MKIFDIDWAQFVQNLEVWEDLALSTRLRFKEMKADQIIRRDQFGEAAFDRLAAIGIFETKPNDLNAVLRPGPGLEFARVMRALFRHDLLASPVRTTFLAYLHEHFTIEQKSAFLGPLFGRYGNDTQLAARVTSQRWLGDFLELSNSAAAREWEGDRTLGSPLPESPYLTDDVRSVAQELARNVATAEAPVPITEAVASLTKATPAMAGAALRACIRYLILFPTLRAPDVVPVLTIWPRVHQRMHRAPTPPPGHGQPVERFQSAMLMDDVTTLLLHLAPPGLRMLADGSGLFARVEKEVIQAMTPVPAWVSQALPGARGPSRLAGALQAAKAKKWVELAGESGVDLRLIATAEGEAWMGTPDKERLLCLLQDRRMLRTEAAALKEPADIPQSERGDAHESALRIVYEADDGWIDDEDDDDDDEDGVFDFDDVDDPGALEEEAWYDHKPWWESDTRLGLGLRETLQRSNVRWCSSLIDECTAALVGVGENHDFVRLDELMAYHSRERNPLIDLDRCVIPSGWVFASDDDLERTWADHLGQMLAKMTVLGGVELAYNDQNKVLFRVNEVGRYLLRLQEGLSLGRETSDATTLILVQPNFEITFLGRSVAMEAKLGRFCERVGSGVGVLFKITRDATFRAAAAGLMPADMIDALSEASAQKLPKNVEREVRGWFEQCRRLKLEAVSIIRCPSAETAALVLSAGRKEVQALSDTLVEYVGKGSSAAFIRKLAQAGIFLDVSKTSGTRKGKAKGRRSR